MLQKKNHIIHYKCINVLNIARQSDMGGYPRITTGYLCHIWEGKRPLATAVCPSKVEIGGLLYAERSVDRKIP